MVTPQHQAPPQRFVFWVLWFALLNGHLIIQFVLGGGIPSGPDEMPVSLALKVIPVALCTAALAIRFMVIPRFPGMQEKLTMMLIGLALAEGAGILSALIIDKEAAATRLTVIVISTLTIIASAPVYASGENPQGPSLR